jgi:RNA polymerase sigma factor for flagellar operon FliA
MRSGRAKKDETVPGERVLQQLWDRYLSRRDPEARRQLALAYLPLVKRVAGRLILRPQAGLSTEDLLGYGVVGLLEALDRYDRGRGVSFEAFALRRIKGAMLDALRRQGWAPRTVVERIQRVAAAANALEQQKGRPVADEEVAAYLGLSVEEVQTAWQEAHEAAVFSLEEFFGAGEGHRLEVRQLADAESPDPVGIYEQKELRATLAEAIAQLSEEDRLVLSLYYYEGLTLKEIGNLLGVSESRACQLRGRALARLRAKIRERGY